MGMQVGAKPGKGATPEINITPLVDIVLVLLIIFMVVLPSMQIGADLSLFKAKTANSEELKGTPKYITIGKSGFKLGEDDIAAGQLKLRIQQWGQRKSKEPVVLLADQEVDYALIKPWLRELQQAGMKSIHMAVEENKN